MSKRNREKRRAAGVQTCRADDGSTFEHREPPYAGVGSVNLTGHDPGIPGKVTPFERWECDGYYGTLRRYEDGLPVLPGGQPYGTGPCAIIGITADSETARHDWRAYQDIKNALVGDEWEAVELYPAESRKVDPSNRFYLFCFPKGVFTFGWGQRNVVAPRDGSAPQRGWLTRGDACPPRP